MPDHVPDFAPALRSAAHGVPQDWPALARHLDRQGLHFSPTPPPRQFSGGLANLNYLIVVDGCEAVLRRPPMGPLPPGAFDMTRESRILSRLWEQFPLAPRSLHLYEDASVLGAPFQITEYRRGISIRSHLPDDLKQQPDAAAQLGRMMIDVLCALHRVDPDSVGLGTLGRPEGFLERAVEGWIKRSTLATEGWASAQARACMHLLSPWLRANRVPDRAVNLIHNDFKLDNILIDPQSLQPVAVLDWDQGTRGDGLFDLATLLSYWTEAGDPPALQALQQMPTAAAGFPTRQQAAEAYARSSGRDLSDFKFHRVLAQFKTAVIFQQLHARWQRSETAAPEYAGMGALADGLLDQACAIAQDRIF